MTIIDRRIAVAEGTAVKAPCRAATTANITLSGEQTIDGVACVEGDRVLVKSQSTGADNGIYTVSTGVWERTRDFDGAYDIVTGTRVFVTSGTSYANTEWVVTTTGAITVGTTSLSFAVLGGLGSTFADGTSGAPGMAFSDEVSSGFWRATSGNVRFGILGSEILQITASGLSITGTLTVSGTQTFTGAATFSSTASFASTIAVTGIATFNATSYMKIPTGTTAQESAAGAAGRLRFNSTTSRLRIDYGSTIYSVMTDAETATQAQAEAASATDVFITPGRMQFHPGVSKAGAYVTNNGSTATLAQSQGIESAVRNSAGNVTLTFTTAMSSTSYRVLVSCYAANYTQSVTRATGSVTIATKAIATGSDNDSDFSVEIFGDQ